MNVLNLPMLESVVAKKMLRDKAAGAQDGKDGDSKKRPSNKSVVPEMYADTLRSLGIDTEGGSAKKKLKADHDNNQPNGIQTGSDDEEMEEPSGADQHLGIASSSAAASAGSLAWLAGSDHHASESLRIEIRFQPFRF